MSEIEKYYQILGLNPGASDEEIREAYRDLVKVWHPDRFVDNPRLREKANEKLKEVNDAYQKLKSYIGAETEQYTTSDRESHRESKPPPHEPPPKWEKEQSSTTESRGYEEPEPSPDEPPKVRVHCSQCGTENSSEAKFCQKCGKPLSQSGRSTPFEVNETGAIWNPNAAANWSLPFTPAFGSYLQMLNWRTLNEPARASSAQSWFCASLLMMFIYFLIGMFMIDPEVLYPIIWWLSFLYLITWYFAAGRSQVKYVKAKFGNNYPKKPWGQALLIAVGCWVVTFDLCFIFKAMAIKDNTHTASVPPSYAPIGDVPTESRERGLSVSVEGMKSKAELERQHSQPQQQPQISYKKDGFSDTVTITQPELMGPKREFTREEKAFIDQHMAVYKNGTKPESKFTHQDVSASEYTSRGIGYLGKGDYKNAIQNFNIAISMDNHLYPVYLNRGCAYYELAQYDKAIEDFKQAIILGPDKAKAYGWCGNAYYASKFYYEASRYFSKAIEIEPNNATFYINRGHAYIKIGNNSAAISDFRKACDLGDEDACKQLRVLEYR